MLETPLPLPLIPPPQTKATTATDLRTQAEALEASFLAEMLKAAGVGKPLAGFGGGGAGEDAFASFLTREYATLMAAEGGIGLSEAIFRALTSEAT
ncbi:MAG: rod-binding protein [Pseudomonadota bacterium]